MHFDLEEGKDQLAPFGHKLLLARKDAFLEVPGQHQELIGVHGARFGFGDDRNVRAGRERAERGMRRVPVW
jgi:hypothetical protein